MQYDMNSLLLKNNEMEKKGGPVHSCFVSCISSIDVTTILWRHTTQKPLCKPRSYLNTERAYIERLRCSACQSEIPTGH